MAGTRHRGLSLAAAAALNGTSARPATPSRTAAAGASNTDWMLDGACNGQDPSLWQPIGESAVFSEQIRQAKATCSRCPVEAICREYALETHQSSGIWGSLTERDRELERRRRSRLAAAERAKQVAA